MKYFAVALILSGLLSACTSSSSPQAAPVGAPGEQKVLPAQPSTPNCRASRDCPDRIRNLSRSDLMSLIAAVESQSIQLSLASSDDAKLALLAAMTVQAFENVMPKFNLEENDLPGGGWQILVTQLAQSTVVDARKPKLDLDFLEHALANDF